MKRSRPLKEMTDTAVGLKTCNDNKKIKLESAKNILLKGLTIHILKARFGQKRLQLLQNQVTLNGGTLYQLESGPHSNVTHFLLEETINKEILSTICSYKSFSNAKFLKCTWLLKSLKAQSILEPDKDDIVLSLGNMESFPKREDSSLASSNIIENAEQVSTTCQEQEAEVIPKSQNLISEAQSSSLSSHKIAGENPIYSGSLITDNCHQNKLKTNFKFNDKFACAHSSESGNVNPNKLITDELEKLASAYQSKKDTWRAIGYQKAINALKNYPKKVETWEEAKNIRGVGQKLADKIKEILEVGKLRKVSEICENEETKTLQLFMGVWGAGATTANDWYVQGFRTLNDLETKANLTRHQRIGLKYYEELNERMNRHEVEKIESQVRLGTENVKDGLEVTVCGSYRRGKLTCGDVDILITHPDGHSHENVFKPLLQSLKQNGFLTDDLVVQENNGNQQKYLGVCKLPELHSKHRRLDIIVVPYKEYAPAIMYFTGSAHFNRSMRLLATKLGMSLSEHGLRKNIVRDGKSFVTGGTLLETPSEESIFQHLGLKYREPQERNH